MKRYAVFGHNHYSASGGMGDFIIDYDLLSDAVNNSFNFIKKFDSVDVYDCEDMSEVLSFGKDKLLDEIKIYFQDALVFEGNYIQGKL
jgi:hypothetical protein